MYKVVFSIVFSVFTMLALFACSEDTDKITAEPSLTVSQPPQGIDYDIGASWTFAYYTSGTKFGFNTYEVVKKGTPEGRTVYTFGSFLNLESSSACKPTNFDTTYRVSSLGMPERFDMSGKIGKG